MNKNVFVIDRLSYSFPAKLVKLSRAKVLQVGLWSHKPEYVSTLISVHLGTDFLPLISKSLLTRIPAWCFLLWLRYGWSHKFAKPQTCKCITKGRVGVWLSPHTVGGGWTNVKCMMFLHDLMRPSPPSLSHNSHSWFLLQPPVSTSSVFSTIDFQLSLCLFVIHSLVLNCNP